MKKFLSMLVVLIFIFSCFILTACKDYSKDNLKASNGLELEKIIGGYKVVGIGTCKDSEIVIPEDVIEIDSHAFKNCTQISKIFIPSTVKKIGNQAFNGCTNLQEVYIDKGVEKLGSMLFYTSGLSVISFSGTSKEFQEIDQGKNYNAWYYVGADYGYKEFFVHCTDVILVYNFKDGNDTPKVKEYEKEDVKTYYLPIKAVSSSSNGTCSIVVELGKNNLPSKQTNIRFGEVIGVAEMIYDSNDRVIRCTNKEPDGTIVLINEYTYDSNGNWGQCQVKEQNGDLMFTYKFKYDEKGQIIEELIIDKSFEEKVEYRYDANGNLIKKISSANGENESVTNYVYDSNNNLIEMRISDSIYKYSYSYDSKGNLIKAVCPDFNTYELGAFITYEVTYDNNGNVSKVTSIDNSNNKITYTFEYKKVTVSKNVDIHIVDEITSMLGQLKSMDYIINAVIPGGSSFG